jgi:hypothetical protein
VLALPHQCDEWEIGSEEDAIALMNDLNVLLGTKPTEPHPGGVVAPWEVVE